MNFSAKYRVLIVNNRAGKYIISVFIMGLKYSSNSFKQQNSMPIIGVQQYTGVSIAFCNSTIQYNYQYNYNIFCIANFKAI